VVLGSANLDVVYRVTAIPRAGETVLTTGESRHPGGKGLNQAVAAARAGTPTAFVACIGNDAAGGELMDVLLEVGIDTATIRRVDAPTGIALITVQDDGDNAIVVAAGANATMVSLTEIQRDAVAAAAVLVAQLEVPLEVVVEAARVARRSGTTFVLNVAPARSLDDDVLGLVDVLVANEHEATTLTAEPEPMHSAHRLLDRVPAVVVTTGPSGCVVATRGQPDEHVPAAPAEVVDTTGAGDTFTGVLAAGMASGLSVLDATRRAVVAAAISVERDGAVPSIPTREQIDARLDSYRP
jgi:ribokinase